MFDFVFNNPTRIFFGKGQISKLARAVPRGSKVLMTYGGGSIKKNGVYDQVIKALEGFEVLEFSGIEPNPTYETLMKAVELARDKGVDFLLAVGGGSVIDGTKFIAAAVKYQGEDPWDILVKGEKVRDALPIGTVLTLPATGSEMNMGAVVTRKSLKLKRNFLSAKVYPRFSILDPETTYSLPRKQIANGVVDAFVHVAEQYLTYPVSSPIQDRFSEGILKTLIVEGPKALENPEDYDTRANIMWAATMALNGLISVGVPQDWATHMIGHEITALHGLDHGQTLAIVMPSLLKIKKDGKKEKLALYARRVWDTESIDEAIDRTRDFFESLGVKTRLSDYGIDESHIDAIVANLEKNGLTELGERKDIDLETSRAILKASL